MGGRDSRDQRVCGKRASRSAARRLVSHRHARKLLGRSRWTSASSSRSRGHLRRAARRSVRDVERARSPVRCPAGLGPVVFSPDDRRRRSVRGHRGWRRPRACGAGVRIPRLRPPSIQPSTEALPSSIRLRPQAAAPDHLTHVVEFALAESRQRRSGAACVLLRLSEVLFVEVVRRYLDGLAPGQAGWLAGLRDPTVGHALAMLHQRPADAWTLERLARGVGVSRSVLAESFTRLVGQPPMQYLARWRMQLAARLLSDGTAKVAVVAQEVGYDSESAFSRAFTKIVGTSPAGWRHRRV